MWNLILSSRRKKKNAVKKRVAILGGTFDPVHKGHIQIVRHLCEKFDRVLVVPAKISPFKLNLESADAGDRLSMLKIALMDMPNAEISDFELKSGGISYSYLTARNFADENNILTYVIGSDMLHDLYKWKNFNELIKLTSFYVVLREGFAITEEMLSDYERLGAKIKVSDLSCKDISSSMIKVDIAFDRVQDYLDSRIYEYIKRYNLYRDYSYITEKYAEFGLKPERIEHTYRAVKEGIRLAKIHGVQVNDAIIALLLHDIGKYINPKELKKKYGIPLIEFEKKMPESCKHAPIGAKIAEHCFGINNESIINAIKTHTTGAPFMDDLAKIVAIADFIEEGRDFKGIEEIRKLAVKDLDLCMEAVLKSTIDHLKGKDIYQITYDAYDYFRILNSKKESK